MFEHMSEEDIATKIEHDIRAQARKWKRAKKTRSKVTRGYDAAATETAALYLQANRELYQDADSQVMRERHHGWMLMMKEWFLSEIGRPKKT